MFQIFKYRQKSCRKNEFKSLTLLNGLAREEGLLIAFPVTIFNLKIADWLIFHILVPVFGLETTRSFSFWRSREAGI